MKRNYYETPKAGWIMRQLWKAAGGDRYILERATYSDQIKYMCLGGIVFATGAMAGLAGGYAFYTIFAPKGSALVEIVDYPTVAISVVFGIIWGLMIFNIDRFIVTSTGKGDGTEKITSEEFKSAIPRIIMGAIIAITISKPIEIRMFQTEINNELHLEQQKKEKEYEIATRKTFEERIKDLHSENIEIQSRIDDYIRQIALKDSLYNVEMTQGNAGRGKGEGPVAIALKNERERINVEMQNFINSNKMKIDEIEKRRKSLYDELEVALSKNKTVSSGLDGLLMRIQLAHKVAGFWITLFITLLFLAIELTPIFFKLMLNKTPYDYLAENRDDLIRAENGIEVRYDYYKDKDGIERHLIINHEADKMIFEKIKITEIQKELTEYAISKYKEKEKEKIDANLDEYIKKINPHEIDS
jgi:hypothetical protein